MLKIKIHRGTHQIGGCATEIECDGTRILIDLGANLPGASDKSAISDEKLIDKVFWKNRKRHFDAILFSHYHGDHVGLYKEIPDGNDMYIGKTAKKIMQIVDSFTGDTGKAVIERMKEYEEDTPIPGLSSIVVKPYLVDHSALDAYMFLIEADGKKILFTGDFREHGIIGSDGRFWDKIEKKIGHVDILITEGTMLSRIEETCNAEYTTEEELGKRAGEIFETARYNFVVVSSTNLDSVMEFYHNTHKDRLFICDIYQASLIMAAAENMCGQFDKYAGPDASSNASNTIYIFDRINPAHEHLLEIFNRQSQSMIAQGRNPIYVKKLSQCTDRKKGFTMLIRPNRFGKPGTGKFEKMLNGKREKYPNQVNVIYSLWGGYLEGKNKDAAIVSLVGSKDNVIPLHTSGHAYVKTIAKLMALVEPKTVIPMHTEMADSFRKVPEFSDYKDNVIVLRDNNKLVMDGDIILEPVPEFRRKNNYSEELKAEIRALWKTHNNLLLIPNESGFIGYCKGIVLLENVSDLSFKIAGESSLIKERDKASLQKKRQDNVTKFTPEYFACREQEYAKLMENDKERRSSQIIALQNMEFRDDEYSVCGWESTISLNDLYDIDKDGAPEMDMVLVNPKEKNILLVEYKCVGSSMLSGNQNLAGHYKDYREIIRSRNFDYIKNELLKAYALMYEIKNKGKSFTFNAKEWSAKIGFLFVDRVWVDGRNAAITDEDYVMAVNRKEFRDFWNDEALLYMRIPFLDDKTALKLNSWKPISKLRDEICQKQS